MNLTLALWMGAACVLLAAVVCARYAFLLHAARERANRAERRFDLLQQIAPVLTGAAAESAQHTCSRILERLGALIQTETLLCFIMVDGRLVLGAKSGCGYVAFLREGQCYEGDTIVDWARDHATAALVGPFALNLPAQCAVVDLSRRRGGIDPAIGPAAGSRDRVLALAIPLLRNRGPSLLPDVIGVVYAERPKSRQFSQDEISTAATVARLASDALQRALFADSVRRISDIDQLTGLMTAASFRKRLREEIQARRYRMDGTSRDIALFFIDTDRFKLWNDTFGHAAGDRLLKLLADMFGHVAHAAGGFAGRNGGDEFCIALLDRTKDAAISVARSLQAKVEGCPFADILELTHAVPVHITVSVGVAHFPVDISADETQPADKLLEAADACMYEAKRTGRNQVAYALGRALPHKVLHPGEGPIPRV